MTDEEVICAWMEPKPTLPFRWHKLRECDSIAAPGKWWVDDRRGVWHHCVLTLDRLHEVEARLSSNQWDEYARLALDWRWQEEMPVYYSQFHSVAHATVAQKIKALAELIRASSKAEEPSSVHSEGAA